jgi:hypothetical protein
LAITHKEGKDAPPTLLLLVENGNVASGIDNGTLALVKVPLLV